MLLVALLLSTAGATNTTKTTAAAACPGKSAHCDCSWTKGGKACGGKDDGSECYCRCCCKYKGAGFECKWKGGPPPPPTPPSPPPLPPPTPPSPPPPPSPPGSCTTDQELKITEYGKASSVWVKSSGKSNKGITVSGGNLTMQHGPRACECRPTDVLPPTALISPRGAREAPPVLPCGVLAPLLTRR